MPDGYNATRSRHALLPSLEGADDLLVNTARTHRIVAIVAEVTLRDASQISTSTHLYADLGLDSLSALELLVAIEDAFAVDIDDEAAKGVRTVGDLIALVSELTRANPRAKDA